MKHILKWLLLLSIVVLATSGIIAAQKPPATFCGDLATADCTFLTDAETVNNNLDSHSFKLELKVDATGLPDPAFKNLSFDFTGSGSVSLDRKGLPDTTNLDATSFSKDPKAIFDLISQSITHVSTDAKLVLNIPQQLKSVMGDRTPKVVNLNFRLVGGTIYLNVAPLADFYPAAKSMPAWIGINIPDAITAMLKQPSFATSMSEMSAAMSSSTTTSMNTKFGTFFADPKNMATFLKVKRLADDTYESHKVAVYETTIDFPALFALPEMMQMIEDQAGASSRPLTDSDKLMMTTVLQQMGKALQFSMTRSIDLDQKYIYKTEINMNIDLSEAKAAFGTAMNFKFNIVITQDDFNAVPALTAPDGAVVIPAESLFPSQ